MMDWDNFIQASCLPYNCGCELIHFEHWIRQPANFWSSLTYIVVGIILLRLSRSYYQKTWSLLCVIVGISSHFAHASYIQLAMSADFASLLSLMVFPVFIHFNLHRSRYVNLGLLLAQYVFFFLMMYHLDKVPKIIFSGVTFITVLFFHFKYFSTKFHSLLFKGSLAFLLWGFLFFLIDELRVYCLPESLLQFHSLWHLLTSIALYLYGRWIFDSGKW